MKKTTAFCFLFTVATAFAQPGNVDPTFNAPDSVAGQGLGVNGAIEASVLQPDHKLVIAGNFTRYNNTPVMHVARLLQDGSTDPAFTSYADDLFGVIYTVDLQSDGKLVIGGAFSSYDGTPVANICRLNADGSIDPSFSATLNNQVRHLIVQPDGKIFVYGDFDLVNGATHNDFVRLNADGTVDNSFNAGNGLDGGLAWDAIMQPDGKVIIGGPITFYNGTPAGHLMRIDTDGTFDATFGNGPGGVYGYPGALALQSDGKILVGGVFTEYYGAPVSNIMRLNTDGSLDASFSASTGANQRVNAILAAPDGTIWIGGEFTTVNGSEARRIAHLSADGTTDASFANDGFDWNVDGLHAIGDTIGVTGEFSHYGARFVNSICMLAGDGTMIDGYNPSSGLGGPECRTIVAPGGGIYVYGGFTYFNEYGVRGLMRLDMNGDPDPGFDAGMAFGTDITCASIDATGRLVIGGLIHFDGDPAEYRLCRLNADGSFDGSFAANDDPGTYIRQIAHLPDGRILVAGQVVLPGDTVALQRLNADGSADTGFDFDPFVNTGMCYSFAVQPDDRIVIGGFFPEPDFSDYESLLRIMPDGTLDASFDTSAVFPQIQKVTVLPDARMLILPDGGALLKVLPDGTPDPGFLQDTVAVSDYALQPNGSILYCGNFNEVGGPAVNNVRRCLADGTPDASFDAQNGSGTTEPVVGITLQDDGNFIITGYFSSYNGTGKNRLARILNCISLERHLMNVFATPSDDSACVGSAAVQQDLLPFFDYSVDGAPFSTAGPGSLLLQNLCPGIHTVGILDACGDTLAVPLVIPVDSNYIFNNPFIDSLALDSLGTTIEDCQIYYSGIDTAYIADIFANGNTVTVTWEIVDANGVHTHTSTYELNNGNGVYYLQLSVFCPQKALGNYFAVTEAVYFADGELWLGEKELAAEMDALIFPNPTTNSVTIVFPAAEADLAVTDAQGRIVHAATIVDGASISLKDQPGGVYFFVLETAEGKAVKRVIKE